MVIEDLLRLRFVLLVQQNKVMHLLKNNHLVLRGPVKNVQSIF